VQQPWSVRGEGSATGASYHRKQAKPSRQASARVGLAGRHGGVATVAGYSDAVEVERRRRAARWSGRGFQMPVGVGRMGQDASVEWPRA
jgi:hypothetical protein